MDQPGSASRSQAFLHTTFDSKHRCCSALFHPVVFDLQATYAPSVQPPSLSPSTTLFQPALSMFPAMTSRITSIALSQTARVVHCSGRAKAKGFELRIVLNYLLAHIQSLTFTVSLKHSTCSNTVRACAPENMG